VRIDVDAHVDETDATWDFLDDAGQAFRPLTMDPGMPTLPGDARLHRLWLIDGQLQARRWRDDKRTGTVQATRELVDIDARLRQMDELRIDVQVLYPTLFLSAITTRPEVELALKRSYNRWIAAATEKSQGRLRWVALLPLLSIDKAVEELRWAKDHGAVGAFKNGVECGDRPASDPYFFPLYEEASRLDIPICIHTGSGTPNAATMQRFSSSAFNAISAFTALATSGVPERFPELRVGFIETGASWVPYLYTDLVAKHLRLTSSPFDFKPDVFPRNRFYVACQTTDDLPYILKFGMEDNLLVGTDYGHADQSAELEALDVIEQRGATGEIPAEVARKILDDNPRRFYGL
jgi:predicted TIM-barrel fold metal-dependent hydrolase